MRIYDKLDDQLMKGVNAGVRAWNWTTGGTKVGLSIGLGSIGIAGIAIGQVESLGYVNGIIAGSILGYLGIKGLKCLELAQNNEIRALEKSLIDKDAEIGKEGLKYVAPVMGITGNILNNMEFRQKESIENSDNRGYLSGLVGFSSLSLSLYVMRADYLPPRKDCISRGMDNLRKGIKIFKNNNTRVPAPVKVKHYSRLEEIEK